MTAASQFDDINRMRKAQQTSVKVMARIRPPGTPLLRCEGKLSDQISLEKRLYTLDCVFGPEANDDDVFKKVGNELIFNTLDGINSCLFVYGQTGTGKTYTMTGDGVNEGLVQRTFRELWHRLVNTSSIQNFTVKLSYIEIYNEEIKDLLTENAGSLQLREHVKEGFFV
jgi:Cdc6-like AAA superfamily ATPase